MSHHFAVMAGRAQELVNELHPYCEQIYIAGSIRRRAAEPSDIELVAVPRFTSEQAPDLFGQQTVRVDCLQRYVRDRLAGTWKGRPDKNGKTAVGGSKFYRLEDEAGYALDLFSVIAPAQLGVILAIRTGPAEFSKRLVTHRRKGGLLPEWLTVRAGALWADHGDGGPVLVPTPTEESFFAAIEMVLPRPEGRR